MRVGHFSDLHGDLKVVSVFVEKHGRPDLWICTGDFFPNQPTLTDRSEEEYQGRWFRRESSSFLRALGDVPVIWCPGNHDFVDARTVIPHAHHITPDGFLDLMGHRFSGFREIPYINGRWKGEIQELDFVSIIDDALSHDPDILVTHTPPYGILGCTSSLDEVGSTTLAQYLMYVEHKIKHHFFGHIHECGGQSVEEGGIEFHNSACCVRMIEV